MAQGSLCLEPCLSSRQSGGGHGCDATQCWWQRRPYASLWLFWRCVVVVLVTWHYCHVVGDVWWQPCRDGGDSNGGGSGGEWYVVVVWL